MKAVVNSRLWVPIKRVFLDRAEGLYETKMYNERNCERCDFLPDRHSEMCDQCPSYLEHIKMWQVREDAKGKRWIGVPKGDRKRLSHFLADHEVEIVDKRTRNPMRQTIKFTGKLTEPQESAIRQLNKRSNNGILKAPPRSGKCVTGDTLIATTQGIMPIRDLFHGEHRKVTPLKLGVLTEKGVAQTGIKYQKVVDRTIRVSTEHGYHIRGTENHPMLVATKEGLVWRNLEDIKVGDWLCVQTENSCFSDKDVETSLGKMCPELAELFGYFTANGYLAIGIKYRRISFSSNDLSIHYRLKYLWHKYLGTNTSETKQEKIDGVLTTNFYGIDAIKRLQDAGLCLVKSAKKTIPESVLLSTKPCVVAFLRAHLTCDSSIGVGMEFTTASPKMATQFHVLLTMLGGFGRRTLKKVNGIKYHRIAYTASEFSVINETLKLVDMAKVSKSSDIEFIPFAAQHVIDTVAKGKQGGWYQVNGKNKQIRITSSKYAFDKDSLITRYRASGINLDGMRLVNKKGAKALKELLDSNLVFTRVTKKQLINKPVRVYDISVPETKSFVANGLVSHNTVMATYQICKLKQKTLIVAAQYDWLKGFYDTFMGSEHQEALTNAGDLLQPSVGFCKTLEDFATYDVCLATYQSLGVAGNLKTKLAKIKNLFGLVVCDEIHDGSAKVYSQVLLTLNPAFYIGLSGTPDRKDGKMFVAMNIVGRVISEIQVKTLVPTVKIIDTNATTNYKYRLWAYAMRFLRTHEKRNALIAKHAAHDIKRGHSIVIPVASIEHCHLLVDLINDYFPNKDFPPAAAFTGKLKKVDRDQLINDARSYKVKCVVGIRKIVQVGLNIPRWSCLYEVEPISNPPKAEQETARIRTDVPGKPKPLIKIFTEDFSQSKGCFRTLWFQTVLKNKFDVSSDTHAKAKKFIAADRKGGGGMKFGGGKSDPSMDSLV